jgi:hypothetical protein
MDAQRHSTPDLIAAWPQVVARDQILRDEPSGSGVISLAEERPHGAIATMSGRRIRRGPQRRKNSGPPLFLIPALLSEDETS